MFVLKRETQAIIKSGLSLCELNMTDWIVPDDYPELSLICWHRRRDTPISEEDAFATYERNWRYVYQDYLTVEEKAFIEKLKEKYGKDSIIDL